jgi:multicomponent Na+:H+ antiporter subunit E
MSGSSSASGSRPGVGGSSSASGSRLTVLRRGPTAIALIAMWIALWGRLSIANVLSGTVVALAVLAVSRGIKPRPVQHFRIVPALRYLVTFLQQLAVANYDVARAVLQPARISPGIIAVPLRHTSDAVVTLVANSITLTPGTLTLEIERRGDTAVLYVHTLDLRDVDAVRDDIRLLERLAIDAFGDCRVQAEEPRRVDGTGGTDERGIKAVEGTANGHDSDNDRKEPP